MQEGRDVAGAARHRHDFDRQTLGSVDDQIRANGPEPNRIPGEVLASVTHSRSSPQRLEGIEESPYPAVGGVDVVRGDVFPDVVKVQLRFGAENVAAQARFFRRSSDLS